MQTRQEYLRDSYEMYLEQYDRVADTTPPLDFDGWLAAYGDDVTREGIALDYIAPDA